MKALQFIFTFLFEGDTFRAAAVMVLRCIGYWFLFKECGQLPWKALIPFYRFYAFSECAGCEREGSSLFAANLVMSLSYALLVVFFGGTAVEAVLLVVMIVSGIVYLMFKIRVFLRIIEVYDQKRIWVIPWIAVDSLVALYWGLSKKITPLFSVSDFREDTENYFSGKNAAVLQNGLTVNLKARTVRDNLFKKKYLLRDIHLDIKPGKMVLLLGGSGAGKTTFINAVNGYEKADAEIMLNGRNMYKEYSSMKYDVGMVPQLDLMRGNDTVFRTLMDASSLRLPTSFDAAKRKARVEFVMDLFGLTPVKDSLLEKLSGGQRKRVSIAMEFISNPLLFILDEPDSGLDGVMARELMRSLRDIADQGKIVLVITHTPDRVIDLFDEVIVLAKDKNRTGRLAYFGSIDGAREFFGKDSMEEILKSINRTEEGGEGRADEFIEKFAEENHG